MAKVRYNGSGDFYQGLPACDFDSKTLTDEQNKLLDAAVSKGMYKIELPPSQDHVDKKKEARSVKAEEAGRKKSG